MEVKKIIWVINAQENPIKASQNDNQRLWRSNSLAQELGKKGHISYRWRSSFSHNEKKQLTNGALIETVGNVNQVYIPTTSYKGHFSLNRILSHYFLGRGFNRVIKRFDLEPPDVIHICNVPLDLLLVVSRFSRKHNIPLIVDVRDLWPEAYANVIPNRLSFMRLLIRRILVSLSIRYRKIIKNTYALTTISDAMMDYLAKVYGRKNNENDRVFHIGSSQTKFQNSSHTTLDNENALKINKNDVSNAPLRLVYAGNIGFQTDFNRIITLGHALEKRNVNFEITICGNGPRLAELKSKTNNSVSINFVGWLNGNELRKELDNADFGLLFFYPNLDFQLSIPSKVSEYLSSTKAILSICDGSVRKLIEEHKVGLDCYSMTDDEIAEKLAEYVCDSHVMNSFANNSRLLFENKFSQQKITSQMAEHILAISERS